MYKNITTVIYSTVVNLLPGDTAPFADSGKRSFQQWNTNKCIILNWNITRWITAVFESLVFRQQSFIWNIQRLLKYKWRRCHLLVESHRQERWLMAEKTEKIGIIMDTHQMVEITVQINGTSPDLNVRIYSVPRKYCNVINVTTIVAAVL